MREWIFLQGSRGDFESQILQNMPSSSQHPWISHYSWSWTPETSKLRSTKKRTLATTCTLNNKGSHTHSPTQPPIRSLTPLTHSLTHPLTHLLTHPLTHPLIHPLTHSPTHSLTLHGLTRWLTHSFTDSLILNHLHSHAQQTTHPPGTAICTVFFRENILLFF